MSQLIEKKLTKIFLVFFLFLIFFFFLTHHVQATGVYCGNDCGCAEYSDNGDCLSCSGCPDPPPVNPPPVNPPPVNPPPASCDATGCQCGTESVGGCIRCLTCDNGPGETISPKGNFDGMDCNKALGWACDADNWNTALVVEFYEGATKVGETTANIPAEAGVSSQCGNVAAHRFEWTTPIGLKNGANHAITAKAKNIGSTGSDTTLANSPKTVNCAAATCPASAPALTGVTCTYNAATKGFDIRWTVPNLTGAGINTSRYSVSRYTMATWKGDAAVNPVDYTNTYPTDNSKWSKYLCVDHGIPGTSTSYPIPNTSASSWAKNWPTAGTSWPGRCDWKLDQDSTTANATTSTMSWRPAYGMGTYSGTIGYILTDNDAAFSTNKEHCKEGSPPQTVIPGAPFTCTVPSDFTATSPYKMTCDMIASNMVAQDDWNGNRQFWVVIGNNYSNALTISGKLNGANNLFNLNFWRSPADKAECNTSGCWYGKQDPITGYEREEILTTRSDPHIKTLATGIDLTSAAISPGRYYIVCNSTLDNLNKCSGNPFISYPNSNGYQDCGGKESRIVLNVQCLAKDKGDATCAGGVNSSDFDKWKEEYVNLPSGDKSADFDGNNAITLKDFEIWRQNASDL